MATQAGRQKFSAFSHILRWNERAVMWLSGLALTAMAFMITADVILRYVFNAPLPASVEISQLLEPYIIFLPMAYTFALGRHVQVTVLTMQLSNATQRMLQVFVLLVDTLFFVLVTWFAWKEFYGSFMVNEIMLAAIRLPWWVGKFAMPLGMALVVVECLLQAACVIRRTEAICRVDEHGLVEQQGGV